MVVIIISKLLVPNHLGYLKLSWVFLELKGAAFRLLCKYIAFGHSSILYIQIYTASSPKATRSPQIAAHYHVPKEAHGVDNDGLPRHNSRKTYFGDALFHRFKQ